MAKDNTKEPDVDVTLIRKLDGLTTPRVSTSGGGVKANSLEYEDEFKGAYGVGGVTKDVSIIEPNYLPLRLEMLCTQNNALDPCIEAMVTNIDGTGYVIETKDEDKQDALKKEIEEVENFFNEPWPGESFTTIRKKVRRDLERTGNAYLEVVRNLKGDVVFLKHVEAKTMRMLHLDNSYQAEKEVYRRGEAVKVKINVRERRFVQKILSKYIYFKDFGSTRDLDKNSGKWADNGAKLKGWDKASEIIHFTVNKDPHTPYGIPRWVNQIPSVLGSRGAEEHNLSFFDSGGIPPMMVFVHGGTLTKDARKAVETIMNTKGAQKHKGAVIEAHSSNGDLNSAGNVRVTVERFGAERQQDSMFEGYDDKCESRIRRSFRLPPLFVGKADDYSFATAFASYTVAEAQVFAPERDEFDEIINLKLIPELTQKPDEIVFRSMPLAVKDATQQLQAITIASGKGAIDREGLVDALNEAVNMDLQVSEEPEVDVNAVLQGLANQKPEDEEEKPKGKAKDKDPAEGKATPVDNPKVTKSDVDFINGLAEDVAQCVVKQDNGIKFQKLMQNVGTLNKGERAVFKSLLAVELYGYPLNDPYAAEELAIDTIETLEAQKGVEDA